MGVSLTMKYMQKKKKMRVKQMVEVKNTYKIMDVKQTVDLIKKKKRV